MNFLNHLRSPGAGTAGPISGVKRLGLRGDPAIYELCTWSHSFSPCNHPFSEQQQGDSDKENLVCEAFSFVAGLEKMFSPRDIPPHPDHGNISQRPGKPLESPEYQLLLSRMGTLGLIPLIPGLLEDEVRD